MNDIDPSNLDQTIDGVTKVLLEKIAADRRRAEALYAELFALFRSGKANPDDLRELNKAQETIQKTTEQLNKILATLARIKVGADKVQIANVQANDGTTRQLDRAILVEMLDEVIALPQDKVTVGQDETE